MSSCPEARKLAAGLVIALAAAAGAAFAQSSYPGIGRKATEKELAAWDIDVRPDFKGLPRGSGSVAKGQEVWEGKCASCHGIFGESNEVFAPLVGGTTKDDVKTGRVARLNDSAYPGRTTLMKLPTLSTLWDYINRAMPWAAPKSLSTEEVYAVTAYLLNMGGVIPDDHVLSDANMAATQQLLPNRFGMSTDHGLWPGKGMGNGGKPDVKAVACMKDCVPEPKVTSLFPEFARNSHGNLAEQQRVVGPQRGADTGRPADAGAAAAVAATPRALADGAAGLALAQKHGCTACHGARTKIVGPGFAEVATRYAGRNDTESYLAAKIQSGGQGNWGAITMPAQALPEADAAAIAKWLATGALLPDATR